jgi:hypothetical protein
MGFIDFVTKWNADMLAMANICIALGTLVLAFGIPWSILYTVREKRDTFYATLDRMYFEILKTAVDHPHLCRPHPEGKTADQICQYDAFAYMVWNFLESIFDYAEDDKVLRETWHSALCYEAKAHAVWFNKKENQIKFKDRFVAFIEEKQFTHQAETSAPERAKETF